MEIIERYFLNLTDRQREQYAQMEQLYGEWNSQINVISRKDIEQIYIRHILHSLAIAKVCEFRAGARVLDVGTGGGFPGVPLAVMFPEVEFVLVDSIGKKIKVVEEVVKELKLENVVAKQIRAEELKQKFDYVVSRAVTDMSRFIEWVWGKIERGEKGSLANGILALKGGNLAEEMARTGRKPTIYAIEDFFEEEFFETKKIVYFKK